MTRYRICPHRQTQWKVQSKGLLFWNDVFELIDSYYETIYQLKVFNTERAAEEWIWAHKAEEERILTETINAAFLEKKRLKTIPPREYP